jgi:hypothetical protein
MPICWEPHGEDRAREYIRKFRMKPAEEEEDDDEEEEGGGGGGGGEEPRPGGSGRPRERASGDAAVAPGQRATGGPQPVSQTATSSRSGGAAEPRPAYRWEPGDDDMVYSFGGSSQHEGMGSSQDEVYPNEASYHQTGEEFGEGSWPGDTYGPPIEPPRARWVENRPENLYQGDRSDLGVARSEPLAPLPSVWNSGWNAVSYSKV